MRLAILSVLGVAVAGYCHSEEATRDPLFELQTAAVLLAEASSITKDNSDNVLVQSIRGTVNFLEDRLRGAQGKLPEQYLASLSADADILHEAVSEQSAARRRELLQLVQADLSLKRTYLQKSAGFSLFKASNTLVDVAITTKAAGKSVDGYTVQCNPKAYGDAKIFMDIFPKQSSPSKGKLAPGVYTCLFSGKNRTDISVGLTGAASEAIDVAINK